MFVRWNLIQLLWCVVLHGRRSSLMNPHFTKQKLAVGRISGLGGVDMFHCLPIRRSWYRIDVTQVLQPNVPLMFENKDAE